MQKAKSIAEIYNEAKQYDCVLTVDAALARGLNRLVDTPRFGTFAVTPRRLAAKYAEIFYPKIYSKFEFVSLLAEETKRPFRVAHAITENILTIWNQTGLIQNVEFQMPDEIKNMFRELDVTNEVYEDKEFSYIFQKYPMLEYALQNFDEKFLDAENIAVIGKELFNELDLQALPKNSFPQELSIFTNEKFAFDKTYLFANTRTLIDKTASLVNPSNENRVAIVLEPNSDYNVLLQARLIEQGCNVLVDDDANENLTIRFMLSLIENAFDFDTLKARDIKEAGKYFGFETDSRAENNNLESLVSSKKADKKLIELYKLMKKISEFTFEEFLNELEKKIIAIELSEFRKLILKVNYSDVNITEENCIGLKYIIENFNIELNENESQNNNGVLFVNAKNSAFINRETIFYIGLDETWAVSADEKPYTDKEKEDTNNLEKFEILLQQGRERLYFTQEIKNNLEVLPAYYFSMFEERPIVNFKDEYFAPLYISGNAGVNTEENSAEAANEHSEKVTTIAPTPLKKFVQCPARYYYSSIIPQKEAPYFEKGNLLHEFAEFYFQHPEFCNEKLSEIMDYMLKQYSAVIPKSEIEIEKTNFKIAIGNIINFLNGSPVKKVLLEEETDSGNGLMNAFGKKLVYDFSEKSLSKDFILSGRADLCDSITIVDYKSGTTRYKKSDVAKLTNIDFIMKEEKDDFDFQVVSYLAALNNENPGKDLYFIYNYILSNRKILLDTRLKSEDNLTDFSYIDLNFTQYLQTQNCFLNIKENLKKDLQRYFEVFDFESYKAIFENVDLDQIDFFDKESVSMKIGHEIRKTLSTMGYNYASFKKRAEKTFIDEVNSIAVHYYNIRTKYGFIFKDDVKKFTEYVESKLAELNLYKQSNFPAKPIFESNKVCKECDYLNVCKGNLLWN